MYVFFQAFKLDWQIKQSYIMLSFWAQPDTHSIMKHILIFAPERSRTLNYPSGTTLY